MNLLTIYRVAISIFGVFMVRRLAEREEIRRTLIAFRDWGKGG